MRTGEMFGLAVKISLGLLLLREAAGATFFHQYEIENMTQICPGLFRKGNITWWVGQHNSSLQVFERRWCNGSENHLSGKGNRGACPPKFPLSNFPGGGIFACETRTEPPILGNKTPVFSSKEDCRNFNFFIVAINSLAEQSSEKTHKKPEDNMTIVEKQNFTVSCEFKLEKGTTTFVVYWFKETKPSKCLFSATNEGGSSFSVTSYDTNCCIDDAFRDRRINSSTVRDVKVGSHKHVAVTITNSTMADSGSYFCVVAAYTSNNKYTWTIVRRISVRMMEASPHKPNFVLKISLAAIAAVLLLMGGIILFLCCRKKAKGKPLECQQRDQTTVDTEDYLPYAVCSRDDLNGQETVYSLATSPGEATPAACFSPQSKPAPGVQENVEILYSKVSKDKNGPSLVSDSSI